MTPALTFFIGLAMLVLFGWYFATDQGPRKRLLAMTLMLVLWPVIFAYFFVRLTEIWATKRFGQLPQLATVAPADAQPVQV